MSNPIIVQVNTFTPVDEIIGKGNDATYDEMDNIVQYIDDYICNLSDDKLEEEFGTSEFDNVFQILASGMPMIEEFHQEAFKDALKQWAELQGKEIEDMVRGYVDTGFGSFQMVHGIGYAWFSADLYGGNSDGIMKNKFDDWAEEELGIRFIFE
jgi:hypothetical protein|nr:MAG TPA_asm: hypothetical protein [Caudoviricetes sp.]